MWKKTSCLTWDCDKCSQIKFISFVVNRFYIFLTRIKELIDFPTTFVALCDFLELNFCHRELFGKPLTSVSL